MPTARDSAGTLGRNDEAVASYRQAVGHIEDVRSQLREERFPRQLPGGQIPGLRLARAVAAETGRTREAFTYAERLRARSYLDLMNRGLPPIQDESRRQTELTLRERVRQLEHAIEQENARPAREQRRRRWSCSPASWPTRSAPTRTSSTRSPATKPAYASVRALKAPSSDDVQRLLPGDARSSSTSSPKTACRSS